MKPDWCPSAVWERAVEVTMGTMAFGSPRLTETIARALLAERDRALEDATVEIEANWGHIATPEMRDAIRAMKATV